MMPRELLIRLLALLAIPSLPLGAQQRPAPADSTADQLRTTLRAFYFSLDHQDWEALSARILPAKIVAHHPVPDSLLATRLRPAPADPTHSSAPSVPLSQGIPDIAAAIDAASIAIDGEWARVLVPRCHGNEFGIDDFRFIRFERRWWIVYIDLNRDRDQGCDGAPSRRQ